MKSFKEHLSYDPFDDFLIKEHKFDETESGKTVTHKSQIAGHKVNVFIGNNGDAPHDVDFAVDNSFTASRVPHKVGTAILRHVASVVHSYKKQINPPGLSFSTSHAKKAKIYHQFADHLVKHYGGSIDREERGSRFESDHNHVKHITVVHFNKRADHESK